MFVTYSHSLPLASFPSDAWQKCRRYSRIVGQTLLFALNTIYLVGQLNKNIPEKITQSVVVLLSWAGLLWLPYSLDLIAKTLMDGQLSYKTDQCLLSVLSFTHVVEMVSNVALLLCGIAAAYEGGVGRKDIQMKIYSVISPVGEGTAVIGLGVALAYFVVTYLFVKKLPHYRKLELVDALAALTNLKDNNEYIQGALKMRYCMDKDTLEQLITKLDQVETNEQKEELMHIALMNIDTQLKIALGGQLGLSILGYILLWGESYSRGNFLINASINFSISLAMLIKVYFETFREYFQRRRIDLVTS